MKISFLERSVYLTCVYRPFAKKHAVVDRQDYEKKMGFAGKGLVQQTSRQLTAQQGSEFSVSLWCWLPVQPAG